jgi:hypothetical protein
MHMNRLKYIVPFIIALLAIVHSSCDKTKVKKKPTDWSNHYDKLNKNPFSFYLTYESLPTLFPNAKTEKLDPTQRLNNLGYRLRKN